MIFSAFTSMWQLTIQTCILAIIQKEKVRVMLRQIQMPTVARSMQKESVSDVGETVGNDCSFSLIFGVQLLLQVLLLVPNSIPLY